MADFNLLPRLADTLAGKLKQFADEHKDTRGEAPQAEPNPRPEPVPTTLQPLEKDERVYFADTDGIEREGIVTGLRARFGGPRTATVRCLATGKVFVVPEDEVERA